MVEDGGVEVGGGLITDELDEVEHVDMDVVVVVLEVAGGGEEVEVAQGMYTVS